MPDSLSRLLLAATFAAEKHRDQRRKDAEESPYINHPIAVANVLVNDGGVTDVNVIAAALLHDTVEDTDTSSNEISATFGIEVCLLVSEVTDDKSLPKADRKQLQVDHAPNKSDGAKQLKIADKICNIRDINNESPATWDQERKIEYLNWASRVVDGCQGVNSKLDRLIDDELVLARTRLQS